MTTYSMLALDARQRAALDYAALRAGVDADDGSFVATVAQAYLDAHASHSNPDVERLTHVTEDDAPASAPRECQVGDIWQLGRHRLICGDSTDPSVVERLMDGAKADLVFTSPPYAQQRDYKAKISDWDALMQGVFAALPAHEKTQVLVNLGLMHRDGEWLPYWDAWIEWMRAQGWRRFGWYVWDKSPGVPMAAGNGRPCSCFEFVFHFNKETVAINKTTPCAEPGRKNGAAGLRRADGTRPDWHSKPMSTVGDTRVSDDVWRAYRERTNAGGGHPAVFPVLLISQFLAAFSNQNDVTYEPFCGSGTSIIAAEQMGRTCYGAELAPEYCDIILARWRKVTGIEPVKQ